MKKLSFIVMLMIVALQTATAMIPGPPRVVECPKCGTEKRLLSLVSGNTFGAVLWSDLYMEANMLPRVSPVQKCAGCGGYFMLSRAKEHYADDNAPSAETGRLSYAEIKEALMELEKDSLERDDDFNLRLEFLHRYNDAFREMDDFSEEEKAIAGLTRTEEDRKMFLTNNQSLIRLLPEEEYTLLRAELYRESGEFEKCIELLNKYWTHDDYERRIIKKLMHQALESDDRVLRLDED